MHSKAVSSSLKYKLLHTLNATNPNFFDSTRENCSFDKYTCTSVKSALEVKLKPKLKKAGLVHFQDLILPGGGKKFEHILFLNSRDLNADTQYSKSELGEGVHYEHTVLFILVETEQSILFPSDLGKIHCLLWVVKTCTWEQNFVCFWHHCIIVNTESTLNSYIWTTGPYLWVQHTKWYLYFWFLVWETLATFHHWMP